MKRFSVLCSVLGFVFNLFGDIAFSQQMQTLPSSGNALFDQQIQNELLILRTAFQLSPRFSFIREPRGPNAFATPDGNVFLGIQLAQKELQEENGFVGNYSIHGVLAHEFGHILQFNAGLDRQMPTKLMELHADFMAGWYLANRAMVWGTDVSQAMNSLYRKGDYDFNSPDHHGTPDERKRAYAQGLLTQGMNVSQAAQVGVQFVATMFPGGAGSPSGRGRGRLGCSLMAKAEEGGGKSNNEKHRADLKDIGNLDDFLTGGQSPSKADDKPPVKQSLPTNLDEFLLK